MAFGGQAVLLQATVGFVRDGALDEAGLEGGQQVELLEIISAAQLESVHQILPASLSFFHRRKQRADLPCDLPCGLPCGFGGRVVVP